MPIINNTELYNRAKKIADEKYTKSSAYKSGFIVKKYKELGGTYSDDKQPKNLQRWFKEDWKDIGGLDYPVYRPTKRVNKNTPLTPNEIDIQNLQNQILLKQKIRGESNLPSFQGKGQTLSRIRRRRTAPETALVEPYMNEIESAIMRETNRYYNELNDYVNFGYGRNFVINHIIIPNIRASRYRQYEDSILGGIDDLTDGIPFQTQAQYNIPIIPFVNRVTPTNEPVVAEARPIPRGGIINPFINQPPPPPEENVIQGVELTDFINEIPNANISQFQPFYNILIGVANSEDNDADEVDIQYQGVIFRFNPQQRALLIQRYENYIRIMNAPRITQRKRL